MSKIQITDLLEEAVSLTALHGTEGLTIRSLAKKLAIPPSLVCYYFSDKDALMAAMASFAIDSLTTARTKLITESSVKQLLQQRIEFQFQHARYVVAVLKYYMGHRDMFKKNPTGYLPKTAYQHIEEIFPKQTKNISLKAKILTHAINGYVLEYFPESMTEREIQALSKKLICLI